MSTRSKEYRRASVARADGTLHGGWSTDESETTASILEVAVSLVVGITTGEPVLAPILFVD